MTPQQKEWIDNATYEQLLKRWRFSETDEIFQGDSGQYYLGVMMRRRDCCDRVAISKQIGWAKK